MHRTTGPSLVICRHCGFDSRFEWSSTPIPVLSLVQVTTMTELSALPVQHTLDIAPPLLPATVLRNDAQALAAAQELAALARIAEVSLREVDHGLIEAAQAMGCRRWHIVWHVLLPEALPGIVGGFTITLVTMINSLAMAGAIGAGGLGDIAYRYGYQRFDTQVMLTVIVLLVVLVVLVAVIQLGGDRLAVRLNKR